MYSKGTTLIHRKQNTRALLVESLKTVSLNNIQILNTDFRNVFNKISDRHRWVKKPFVYADPPYFDTVANYKVKPWTKRDRLELVELLTSQPCFFMMSEFYSTDLEKIAKDYNLRMIVYGERRTIGNRQTEVILINYTQQQPNLI